MQDKVAKGRHNPGDHVKGSRHPGAKLTEDQVREIRKRCDAGGVKKHIARDYGVGEMTVGRIHRRERWVHLQ